MFCLISKLLIQQTGAIGVGRILQLQRLMLTFAFIYMYCHLDNHISVNYFWTQSLGERFFLGFFFFCIFKMDFLESIVYMFIRAHCLYVFVFALPFRS